GASESARTSAAQQLYNSYPQIGGSFLYPAVTALPGVAGSSGLLTAYINNFGVASPRTTVSPFTQLADTLSFTKGAHSFSVGAELDFTSSVAGNTGGTQTTRPEAYLGINAAFPSPITSSKSYATGIQAADITTASNLLATLAGSINGFM